MHEHVGEWRGYDELRKNLGAGWPFQLRNVSDDDRLTAVFTNQDPTLYEKPIRTRVRGTCVYRWEWQGFRPVIHA